MKTQGKTVKMVDISSKEIVSRYARAKGRIKLKKETIKLIRENKIEKGDVFSVSKTAGILAAKNTPQIIPLCHPIPLEAVDVSFEIKGNFVEVTAEVRSTGKTGVEMEALTAVSASLLTVWDMVKKYEKDIEGNYPYTEISNIRVIEKVKEKLE